MDSIFDLTEPRQKKGRQMQSSQMHAGFGQSDVDPLWKFIKGPTGREKLAKLKEKKLDLQAEVEAEKLKQELHQLKSQRKGVLSRFF
jgi:hypothetical protein